MNIWYIARLMYIVISCLLTFKCMSTHVDMGVATQQMLEFKYDDVSL